MPYYVEFVRESPVSVEPSFERLPEAHVSIGAAQQHAFAESAISSLAGRRRAFRIVDEDGEIVVQSR